MIDSLPIAQDAVTLTGVDRSAKDLVEHTTPQLLFGTQLIKVLVSDRDPAVAKQLADALLQALVAKVLVFEPSAAPGEGDVPALPAYVFAKADLPTEPVPSGLLRNLILGGLFGFVAAAAVTFLLEYLDITIRDVEDAERRLELPVLGVIPVRESNRRVDRCSRPRPAGPNLRTESDRAAGPIGRWLSDAPPTSSGASSSPSTRRSASCGRTCWSRSPTSNARV